MLRTAEKAVFCHFLQNPRWPPYLKLKFSSQYLMMGSPTQKISLLGGLAAEKQLKKEVFCHFFKNPRWPTFVFLGCASSWDSYASNGIIYLVSILSVSGARATYMHISSQTSSHLHAVWRCPEKIS